MVSMIDELVEQVPIDRVAGQLGVDRETAERAIRQVLPALVGGMEANAQDPAGAASLFGAIGQHDGGLLDRLDDLDRVDTADGGRIVSHVFGANEDGVVNQLGGLGAGSGLVRKLLPILAPIVMAWLAKKLQGQGGGAASAGGLGDLLGSILGGAMGGASSGAGQGQGSASGGQGGLGGTLGDLLGGLLGAGRR